MSFQQLKDSVSDIRGMSPNFAEWDTSDFPEGKLGNSSVFSAAEACVLLEQLIQNVEIALEKEQLCIASISPEEMQKVATELSGVAENLGEEEKEYVSRVEKLIALTRPFAMLSMEKMDSKRYREVSSLEDTLTKIRGIGAAALRTVRKVKAAESRILKLNSIISTNQERLKECGNMHEQMTTLSGEVQSMRDDTTARKAEIDQFSSLIQKREKSIASQEAATEDYKKKLTEFSAEAEAAEAARDTKNKEKLAEFSASCASSMKEAQKLIDNANQALRLTAAQGLAVAFKSKEEKSGNRVAKVLWLFLLILAAAAAVAIGLEWTLLGRGGNDDILHVRTVDAFTVLRRALAAFVAIGIAGFAIKQYAKNKTIEEDYAYKAALAASFPGFANELGKPEDEAMRKEYTSKLLAEILQDPQRVRKAERIIPFSRPKKSSEN